MEININNEIDFDISLIIKELVQLTNEKILDKEDEKVNEDTELLMLDIFDSIGMVIFLSFIEEKYQVQIPDAEVVPENFQDFESIARLVITQKTTKKPYQLQNNANDSPIKRAIMMVQNDDIKSKEFVLSNGEKVHTLSVQGEKETWILIPGLGNPSSSWVSTLQGLTEDYSAYAIDFNGFGISSSIIERPTFRDHYNALDKLLQQLDEESYVIVGSSAGSMIGMEMARRYPEKIKALVVTGFGLIDDPVEWWDHLQKLSKNPASFLEAAYHRPPELNSTLEGLIQDVMSKPAYWSFLEGGGLDEMKNCADNINVPTLFVCGESDHIIPKKAVENAFQKIPNAQLEWLARCGHFPLVEQPEELLYVIKNFLKTLN